MRTPGFLRETPFGACCHEASTIEEWETLEEYGAQLAACLWNVFCAERAALFRLKGKIFSCLGLNLSRAEIEDPDFAFNCERILMHIKETRLFLEQKNGIDALYIHFCPADGEQ